MLHVSNSHSLKRRLSSGKSLGKSYQTCLQLLVVIILSAAVRSDSVVIAVDYEGLDTGQLTELKMEANKEHLDGLTKKKRRKLLRKRTKEMLKKAKVIKSGLHLRVEATGLSFCLIFL